MNNLQILDPLLVVVKESLDEMYMCWDILTFIADSFELAEIAKESSLELMNHMNLNN